MANNQALDDQRFFKDLEKNDYHERVDHFKAPELSSYRLPPSDWRDGDSWEFLGFIMHFHTQQCRCGARHSWTQTLRLFGHKTYVASRGHRAIPFHGDSTGMPHNEPLALYTLPDEHVVICHKCLGGYQAAGSDVIELRAAADQSRWLDALLTDAAREREARRRQAASAAKPDSPAKPAASLNDILSL